MTVKLKKNTVLPAARIVGLAVLLLLLLFIQKEIRTKNVSMGSVLRQGMAESFCDILYRDFIPSFLFVQEGGDTGDGLLAEQITGVVPLYGYALKQQREALQKEEYLSLDEIVLAEASEESDFLKQGEQQEENAPASEEYLLTEVLPPQILVREYGEELAEQKPSEEAAFVPHTKQMEIDIGALSDYETLVENYYTIDSNTMAGSDQLNIEKLLGKDMSIAKEEDGVQILIYHTHSQEGFADSVAQDAGTTIVGVGERLAQILTEDYGYRVLHHTGQYDVETRDDAYSKSLPAIEQVLAENPEIQVIIDLHRDSMPKETRLVMDLDGKPTARFMFFNGLSRTRKTGDIAYLYNENQEDNLAFSFQMKLKAESYYPGLTRKIYLKGYRYNMHLRPRTLLVELGAQNNTVEEAMNACEPLAHILDMVLTGQ